MSQIDSLTDRLAGTAPAAALAAFRREVEGIIVCTTSFGLEDQAITHLIASQALDIEIVTLDTGRLFPETYDVWSRTEDRYGIRIGAIYPEAGELEELVAGQGINGFRSSVLARKACCGIRKVALLERLLSGASGWITGLRADQSAARSDAALLSWDGERGLQKLNPLIAWTRDDAVGFRDPWVYERFDKVILIHGVREVAELAYAEYIERQLPGHELIGEQAAGQLIYYPTVTREPFRNRGRITALIETGSLFADLFLPEWDSSTDRAMLCGGPQMLGEMTAILRGAGFTEGNSSSPGSYVIEKAFVEK